MIEFIDQNRLQEFLRLIPCDSIEAHAIVGSAQLPMPSLVIIQGSNTDIRSGDELKLILKRIYREATLGATPGTTEVAPSEASSGAPRQTAVENNSRRVRFEDDDFANEEAEGEGEGETTITGINAGEDDDETPVDGSSNSKKDPKQAKKEALYRLVKQQQKLANQLDEQLEKQRSP